MKILILGKGYIGNFYLEKHKNSNRLFKHDIEYTWIEGDKKAKHWMDSLGHMTHAWNGLMSI
ncbi:hypothetical protein EBU94_02120 [bacterium]|nr:hypothetical protein [bacterium]